MGSVFALDQLPRDHLPQIAVAGRSNVGKSSLLNRVVSQKKLAKVSRTPGRTRSLNFFKIDNRYYVVDLPGYGYAKVSKSMREEWGQMIDDYLHKGTDLIGLVLLLDCRRDVAEADWHLIEWLAEKKIPVVVAITKADKLTRDKLNRRVETIESELGVSAIPFSVVTGIGKNELWRALNDLVNEHILQTKARTNG